MTPQWAVSGRWYEQVVDLPIRPSPRYTRRKASPPHWGRGHPLSPLDTNPTRCYPGSTMNKTETLAYQWLQDRGYSVSDIIFRGRTSPDFITADGKGWEVKLTRRWHVAFTKPQVANLRTHPDVMLLLYRSGDPKLAGRVDDNPQDVVPFAEVEVPGQWGKYRLRLMEGENGKVISLRLPDDVHEAMKAIAQRECRSLNAQVVWELEQAVAVYRSLEALEKAQHQPDTSDPPSGVHIRVDGAWVPPLDAEGIPPDSAKGKASLQAARKVPASEGDDERARQGFQRKLPCTCGPGERRKGHNKKCPAREA